MAQRGHLNLNIEAGLASINPEDSNQAYAQTYLSNLLLPYIESYWITLVYFIENRKLEEEESLNGKIQWLAESLFEEGQCHFQEACS